MLSPKSGDVLEQGAEVTLSADVGIERAGEAFVVSIADGRSWSGRWWRVVAERVRAGADGEVRLRYRVPRDLAASDAYVVKFAALDAGGAKHAPSAEVSGVKVSTPLKITPRTRRGGRRVVPARADRRGARDGWRLAVDVVPCVAASETETQAMVVGELFLQAATDGLTVHTRRSSVLFDVNRDEAAKRRKRLRLTADRSYRVALAGFTVGELEPVFGTARVECRMRLVQLRAVGGGYNTPAAGARRVALGDAERRRPPAWGGQVQTKAAAGKTKGERQARGGGETSSNPAIPPRRRQRRRRRRRRRCARGRRRGARRGGRQKRRRFPRGGARSSHLYLHIYLPLLGGSPSRFLGGGPARGGALRRRARGERHGRPRERPRDGFRRDVRRLRREAVRRGLGGVRGAPRALRGAREPRRKKRADVSDA